MFINVYRRVPIIKISVVCVHVVRVYTQVYTYIMYMYMYVNVCIKVRWDFFASPQFS